MGDSLYLSLWFPSFAESEILPRTVQRASATSVFCGAGRVTYAAIQPVSWGEPTILERRFLAWRSSGRRSGSGRGTPPRRLRLHFRGLLGFVDSS